MYYTYILSIAHIKISDIGLRIDIHYRYKHPNGKIGMDPIVKKTYKRGIKSGFF